MARPLMKRLFPLDGGPDDEEAVWSRDVDTETICSCIYTELNIMRRDIRSLGLRLQELVDAAHNRAATNPAAAPMLLTAVSQIPEWIVPVATIAEALHALHAAARREGPGTNA